MARCKLKNTRAKAQFGEAIAAAGIGAAATMAAAGISAAAAKQAAIKQSQATITGAKQQANSLLKQNDVNTQLQNDLISFQKEENQQNREIMNNMQMTMQMQNGQLNVNDRNNAARIQVKRGGKVNRTFLRGVNSQNMPFRVTDGGGVIPVGTTPEGYNLFEIYGDNHEHYHKTKGGKYKSGVGFKFANGATIEGEGNQNSGQGELLLTTPTDAYFISKHSIKGFNPAQAVEEGMHPLQAYNTQEVMKDATNNEAIAKYGNRVYNKLPVERLKLKCGGRPKAEYGWTYSLPWLREPEVDAATPGHINYRNNFAGAKGWNPNYDVNSNIKTATPINSNMAGHVDYGTKPQNTTVSSTTTKSSSPNSWWTRNGGNLIGAGINGISQIGGALIANIGNNLAAKEIATGAKQAASIMSNAYSKMRGIDPSQLSRNDFRAAHSMVALRDPRVNVAPEMAINERMLHRGLTTAARNNRSAAAMANRMSTVETNAYDMRSNIYGNQAKLAEGIKQGNVERISAASEANATRDLQANLAYKQSHDNILMYNNNIENAKIAGIGQVNADAVNQVAQTMAGTHAANAQSLAGAVGMFGKGYGDAFAAIGKQENDFRNTMIGADTSAAVRHAMMTNDRNTAYNLYMMLKDVNNSESKGFATALKNKFGF